MTEFEGQDTPLPTGAPVRERRQAPRSVVQPPDHHRTAAVFPEHSNRTGQASLPTRVPLWEALQQPRNLVPLSVIIVLALVEVGLLTGSLTRRVATAPNPLATQLMVWSSKPGTSLFGNGQYLGEIGPRGRTFTVVPGPMRLHLVRNYCQASDTTLDLKAGEELTVGPLDPSCSGSLGAGAVGR